ncbi:hypothetical protein Lsan_0353 [Legionella santicrucis]|uniref:Uncharacterized protein n=1 Tax=Legionella santicrucis TaxID=45074 RepID=A0A0W0ZFG9_9GAMM|nr:hypothetical protein [Legionella santicrucis]KTD67558.1 hypothetical protein Lsan_0353 [Legionella santicrucis]
MVKNKHGKTVLERTVSNPGCLKVALELLPENQRLEAVMIQNIDGNTVTSYGCYESWELKGHSSVIACRN